VIIAIEGAPAVGKSTIAGTLNFQVVPEVNRLFGKKPGLAGDSGWYLERQLDRWQLAENARRNAVDVVLDGDVLQPLWFSACFWRERWGNIGETANFFEKAISNNRFALPDKYICLVVDEETRAQREHERCIREKRHPDQAAAKIARYAPLGSFLAAYFSALNEAFPGLASVIEARRSPDAVASLVKNQRRSPPYSPQKVVRFACEWCRQYKADAQRA
jgi:hypothetical protein